MRIRTATGFALALMIGALGPGCGTLCGVTEAVAAAVAAVDDSDVPPCHGKDAAPLPSPSDCADDCSVCVAASPLSGAPTPEAASSTLVAALVHPLAQPTAAGRQPRPPRLARVERPPPRDILLLKSSLLI